MVALNNKTELNRAKARRVMAQNDKILLLGECTFESRIGLDIRCRIIYPLSDHLSVIGSAALSRQTNTKASKKFV